MNDKLRGTLAKFIEDNGIDALGDYKRVRNYMGDYAAKESKAARTAIVNCLQCGFHAELRKSDESERWMRKNRLVRRLYEEHGIDRNFGRDALDTLETVMFGNVSVGPQEEQAEQPAASPTPAVKPAPKSAQSAATPTPAAKPAPKSAQSAASAKKTAAPWLAPIVVFIILTAIGIFAAVMFGDVSDMSDLSQEPLSAQPAEASSLLRTLTGHGKTVFSAAYSPYGRRIASASYDGTIKIWDAESGALMHTLTGHDGSVYYSAAYSPDGRRIVSASYDGTIKIWDAEGGALLRALTGHTDIVRSVAYSPDGKRIVSASYDNTIKIWDAGL
jgi:hypothetical protein